MQERERQVAERIIADVIAEAAADEDWEKVNVRRHDAPRFTLIVNSSAQQPMPRAKLRRRLRIPIQDRLRILGEVVVPKYDNRMLTITPSMALGSIGDT